MNEGRLSPEQEEERGISGETDSQRSLLNSSGNAQPSSARTSRMRVVAVVATLTFVNLINYMDRYTLAGILSDVKDYFHIKDDKGGLLQTVFVVSYMFFAPLFGYLGDRYSRSKIMAAGVFLWSLTTLIGSFMPTFGSFIFFRALVGIGEASYSTIAPTIISDMFVEESRSKILAIFYFAIPVGSGLGYILGSWMASLMGSWQWGLRLTPILGAIAVILILVFVKDPERGAAEGGNHISATSYKDDLISLAKNRSFMLSTAGFTCVTFVTGALAWWGPNYIYLGLKLQSGGDHVSLNDVSFKFGLITMISGIIGVPLGTFLSRTFVKLHPKTDPIICSAGLLISVIFLALAMITIEYQSTLPFTLVFFGELALNMNWAIVADMLLYVVIPTRRSTAEAFQILFSHAFGDASSPYLVGVLSECLKTYFSSSSTKQVMSGNITAISTHHSENVEFTSLQYALFLMCFVEVLGGAFFLLTSFYIVRDKKKVDDSVAESNEEPKNIIAESVTA